MQNLTINFSNPWFLLLLIPAVAFALFPYFRMNKRYRKTRNRITSIVLHLIVMFLSVSVLAGISIEYDTPNAENEVILLVDVSDSGDDQVTSDRNDFVKTVIDNCDSMFKLGVVTFGFDQVYAAPMSNDTTGLYAKYLQAPLPDTTATDLSSALSYTSSLFTNPKAGRIILISDAIETDGDASSVIKAVAAMGVKVDTVYLSEENENDEVQIIDMQRSEEKIKVGEQFTVTLTLQSSFEGNAVITPYDNAAAGEGVSIVLEKGIQTIDVPYLFTLPGMHDLSFEIEANGDTITNNNVYNSFIYLEIFDDILVIESLDGESTSLCDMLREELKVTVLNVGDITRMPKTVEELRAYDEIILCNVANADLPEGFDKLLYSFVYDYGGGLFTVCGNKEDANPNDDLFEANAYTKKDMNGTLYQQMLPITAIEYTPPVAVMILIDRSGSMYDPNSGLPEENSKLGYAKQGAEACLDALTERDYIGIMSLGDDYNEQISLTPRPQRDKILAAIESIKGGGGTIFSDAIERAGKILEAQSNVERRHIIIVTDGEPSPDDEERYTYWLDVNRQKGITTSIVGIQANPSAKNKMIFALTEYAGMTDKNFHDVADVQKVPQIMREDLMVPDIKDVNYTSFKPTVDIQNSVTAGLGEIEIPELDGFYGVKLKEGATQILGGEYTPIYAQWQFGKGTVGTFACDLNGVWSSKFIDSDFGVKFVNNAVQALFPVESIRPTDIELEAVGENYKTTLSVFTDLEEGQTVEVTVKSPALEGEVEGQIQTFTASSAQGYSRLQFAIKAPGIHEITAKKLDETGAVISETTMYKALSYSKEYDAFVDTEAAKALSDSLAADSNGVVITDPWDVFLNIVQRIHHVIDPKMAFIITALVLFLLDIAARKFKWKWPHEIIRDSKKTKALKNGTK